MIKKIERKRYEKPFMMVFELRHQQGLLQSSLPTDSDPSNWPGGEPW